MNDLTADQKAALWERATTCPCSCGEHIMMREDGWSWADPDFGDFHSILYCVEAAGSVVIA